MLDLIDRIQCFDVEFNVVAALQPAAGADGDGEGRVPRRRVAQVSDRQRASVAGGWSNGAAGETATYPAEGAVVC